MARHRRRDLVASRRRVDDEGEDDGSVDPADVDDDSLSEDGSTSSLEDPGNEPAETSSKETGDDRETQATIVNGDALHHPESRAAKDASSAEDARAHSVDRNAVLRDVKQDVAGGKLDASVHKNQANDHAVPEASPAIVDSQISVDHAEAPHERKRREHEEYRKKRDQDPAFVPNRGAFFMHDHRHAGPAANGFRPFGRGRGRGRAGFGNAYPQ